MTVTVKHSKTNAISDWTQAQLDEQIELGNFAPGTTLANIVLPSDWNNDHTLTGVGTMAEQDANSVAITGGTINGTTIGATTASTGTFTTLIGGADVANYGQLTGGATTKAIEWKSLGSDSNVAFSIRSKGTGAINLAAGSSGVNISNGGTVTAITRTAGGSGYATAPTVTISPPTTAGGVQATATCTVTAGSVNTTFTITNAGSGYIEQPTVTFSGGGGSGAAAYATVGSIPTVKTIASALSFTTPSSEVFRIVDANSSGQNYISLESSGGGSNFRNAGAGTNLSTYFISKGTGTISFATNASTSTEQLRVAHTASAVNYVQVTGGATTVSPVISAQGSDTNISLNLSSKGTGVVNSNPAMNIGRGSTNWVQGTGSSTGVAVGFSALGGDTNIDLALTPKGTGLVRFGTYVAGALTATGYINIKAADGTTYKVLVST
jgi:hypothetical protein